MSKRIFDSKSINQKNSLNKSEIFMIQKNNKNFRFSLLKNENNNNREENNIIIQCQEESNILNLYEIKMKISDFTSLSSSFSSLEGVNDIHTKLLLFFRNNKVNIESMETNKINISFMIFDMFGNMNKIELCLNQKESNNSELLLGLWNEISSLKSEISSLKEENQLLKKNYIKEINVLKTDYSKEINFLKSENNKLKETINSINLNVSTLLNSVKQQNSLIKYNNEETNKEENKDEKEIQRINEKGITPNNGEGMYTLSFNSIREENYINISEKNSVVDENNFKFLSMSLINIKNIEKISNFEIENNDYIFTVIKTLKNHIIIVYLLNKTSIIFYNLTNGRKDSIIDCHINEISFLKNFVFRNQRDFLVTCSIIDNKCKFWDIESLKCLLNINIKFNAVLSSICLFNQNNNIFVYASSKNEKDPIKIYDLNGEEKKIECSEGKTNYINIFLDIETQKYYLISCNDSLILSFDLVTNKLYKSFISGKVNHLKAILFFDGKNSKLVDVDETGLINIFNFNKSLLIGKISLGRSPINELILWNEKEEYVICCDKYSFNLISLKNGIIKYKKKYENGCRTLKMNCPNIGDCLIIQDISKKLINLWKIK